MSEKKGTKALELLILLIVAIGESWDKAMADGEITLRDGFSLASCVDELIALAPHATDIIPEIKDLDDDERH